MISLFLDTIYRGGEFFGAPSDLEAEKNQGSCVAETASF